MQAVIRTVTAAILRKDVRTAPHSLEVSAISLFSSHHNPHGAPLSDVQRLHHPRNLIHKTDRTSYVVEHFHVSDLRRVKMSRLTLRVLCELFQCLRGGRTCSQGIGIFSSNL